MRRLALLSQCAGYRRPVLRRNARSARHSADIRQGTQRDAILFSLSANASHGHRRTNDDKLQPVMVLLNERLGLSGTPNRLSTEAHILKLARTRY